MFDILEGDVIAAYQEGIITTAGRGVKELIPRAANGLQCKAQVPFEYPWFTPGAPPVMLGAGRLRLQKDFPTQV